MLVLIVVIPIVFVVVASVLVVRVAVWTMRLIAVPAFALTLTVAHVLGAGRRPRAAL